MISLAEAMGMSREERELVYFSEKQEEVISKVLEENLKIQKKKKEREYKVRI